MSEAPALVIFACVHNAGRSQMASAMFSLLADPSKATCISAGTQPGSRVHPEVVEAMSELGFDLSGGKPQLLTKELMTKASLVITMGCGEACPYIPGVGMLDWPLEDPKGKTVEVVRFIRDTVKALVEVLLEEKGWGK